MFILGFETTGPVCSASLIDLEDESRVFLLNEKGPMKHLMTLAENAKRLMEDAQVEMDDIAAVAVSVGPGSFTGIRIGVTTARAIAQARNISCVAVSSLEIFRERAKDNNYAVPIFNARRGQVYGAILGEKSDMIEPGPYMLEDIFEAIKNYGIRVSGGSSGDGVSKDLTIEDGEAIGEARVFTFYGDGVDAYSKELEEFSEKCKAESWMVSIDFAPESERYQTADMTLRLAAKKYRAGDTCQFNELMPDYMRKAEAEQKLENGTLEKLRKKKLERLMNEHGL